ncbi:13631_t:CDS:1, partial [Ambispora leptoticha]
MSTFIEIDIGPELESNQIIQQSLLSPLKQQYMQQDEERIRRRQLLLERRRKLRERRRRLRERNQGQAEIEMEFNYA